MELHEYFTSINTFTAYPQGAPACVYTFSRLPQLAELFAPFDLPAVARAGDTFTRARRILQWVADSTTYDGASPLGPARPDKIIRFAIEEKKPINCANRALLFCDALVSLGIFAHPVNLEHRPYLPAQERLGDECHSHVIAQVWLPEIGAWAAFDPSFNTFFTDESGACVGISAMLTMRRTASPARSVDNATWEATASGSLCTQIGLFCISILPGNDPDGRRRWDDLLFLVPPAYLEAVSRTEADEGWAVWQRRLLTNRKLTLQDLTGAPRWAN